MSRAALSCISTVGLRCLPSLRELEVIPLEGTKERAVTVPKHNSEEVASPWHNWCQCGDKGKEEAESKTQHFETLNFQCEVRQAFLY